MENEPTLDSLKAEISALQKRLRSFEAALLEEQETTTRLRTDLNKQIQANLNNMRRIAALFEELHKTGKITDHLVIT